MAHTKQFSKKTEIVSISKPRSKLSAIFKTCCAAVLVSASPLSSKAQVQDSSEGESTHFDMSSPWPRSHRTHGQQAATPLPGPLRGDIQVRRFTQDAKKSLGTAPFMVLSGTKYPSQPNARTVWGTTLTDLYKYEVDGDNFQFADSFELNALPLWVGWNTFRLPGDRIIVPNPSGLRLVKHKGTPCYGTVPALLVFKDGDSPSSPIKCIKKFEFSKRVLKRTCGFSRTAIGTTAVLTGELPSGHIAVTVVSETGRGRRKKTKSYLAVLDPMLDRMVACSFVGNGTTSNQFPVERAPSGLDLAYLATETELVKMAFDPKQGKLRRQEEALTNYRNRTGTTPTLLNTSDGRKLIVTVDGRCAVEKLFTGDIRCADSRPSQLVVLDRTNLRIPARRVPLPDLLETIENSPAAIGDSLIVTNYSGYTPNGKKDGQPDFARGVVKMRWTGQTFKLAWLRDDIQMNGVPTISLGSGMVYSSGAEPDGMTYIYGLDLDTGITRLRAQAGPSTNRSEKLKDGVYDAGNNFLINDDGSAIFPAGETLVRVK